MAEKIVQLHDTSGDNLYPMTSIDTIYPVGSIYLSVNATNPGSLFGGTWIQVAQGRTLFGAGTLSYTHTKNGSSTTDNITYTAGDTVAPGLPNIAAGVVRAYSDYNKGNDSTSGGYGQYVNNPFYFDASETYGTNSNVGDGSYDGVRNIKMDLTRYDSLYSNNVKVVQPAAFVVYMWQRTA